MTIVHTQAVKSDPQCILLVCLKLLNSGDNCPKLLYKEATIWGKLWQLPDPQACKLLLTSPKFCRHVLTMQVSEVGLSVGADSISVILLEIPP